MGEEFQIALYLLVIGMITVVLILLLVVTSANVLIKLVNKFGPEPKITKKKARNNTQQGNKIEQKQLVVLTAVVEHITKGKGVIKEIKKAN